MQFKLLTVATLVALFSTLTQQTPLDAITSELGPATTQLSPAKAIMTSGLGPAKAIVTPAPSALSAFSADFQDFVTKTLLTDSAFMSLLAAAETNAAEHSLITAAFTGIGYNPAALSSLIDAVPTQFQAFVTSVAAVESSIAVKDGVIGSGEGGMMSMTSMLTPTASVMASTTTAATSTTTKASSAGNLGKEMGFAIGAVCAGLGLVITL